MKKMIKLKITEYWQFLLGKESLSLQSLKYFDPLKCSLLSPHPMWTSSAHSSYESNKTKILARMVSGRYRTEMLCRFWSPTNTGHCLAQTCHQVEEDLEHLLIKCPALQPVRQRLQNLWTIKASQLPELHTLILKVLSSPPDQQLRFILTLLPTQTLFLCTRSMASHFLIWYSTSPEPRLTVCTVRK